MSMSSRETRQSPPIENEESQVLKITVNSVMQGVKKVVVQVKEKALVSVLKFAIELVTEVSIDKQVLLYKGNELKNNDASIADYGITSDTQITMNVKMSTGLSTRATKTDLMFLVPALLPTNTNTLRRTIKDMNCVCQSQKSKTIDNSRIWTPEKKLETELTRNRMKSLLRKKRKMKSDRENKEKGKSEMTPMQYSPIATPPSEARTPVNSESSQASKFEILTEKEIKLFFDVCETIDQLKSKNKNLYVPPKDEAELLQYSKNFEEDRKTKCNLCRKKLSAAQQTMQCKCKGVYCDTHRLPRQHTCKIDYKQDERLKLIKTQQKIESGGARKAKFNKKD